MLNKKQKQRIKHLLKGLSGNSRRNHALDSEQQQEREKEKQVQNFGLLPEDPGKKAWIMENKDGLKWDFKELLDEAGSLYNSLEDIVLPFETKKLQLFFGEIPKVYISENHTSRVVQSNTRLRPVEVAVHRSRDDALFVLSLAEASSVRELLFREPAVSHKLEPFRMVLIQTGATIYQHPHFDDQDQTKYFNGLYLLWFFNGNHYMSAEAVQYLLNATRARMSYSDRRHFFSVSKNLRRKPEIPGDETSESSPIKELFNE